MTLLKEESEIMIKYRSEQADRAFEEAKFLIEHEKFNLAVN